MTAYKYMVCEYVCIYACITYIHITNVYICKYMCIDIIITYIHPYTHAQMVVIARELVLKYKKLGLILHTCFMTVTDLTYLEDEAY